MYSESTLLGLIDLIYDAAADPQRWPAFLGRYQELLAARNVALGYAAPEHDKMLVVATGADEGDVRKYHQYPCPWLERLILANWRTGGAGASHHLISDSELEQTVCFNEFLGPRRFNYGMGAAILAVGDGPATFVTLREKRLGPYSDEDLTFLRALLPHMSRALQLYGRMLSADTERRALADSLDRLSTGLLLLDAAGRVLFANRAVQEMASQNDGLRLQPDGLAAAVAAETAALRQLIARAALTTNGKGLHPGGAMLISRPSLRRSFAVSVSPVPKEAIVPGLRGSAAVAVFVLDPEALGEPDGALLERLYGLTPAESRVAAALLNGHDLRAAASELGVSYHTARAQAKSIFSKTGTRGQSDLIRLLLKLPSQQTGIAVV